MFVVATQDCPPYRFDRRMVTDMSDHSRIILPTISPDSSIFYTDRMDIACDLNKLGSLQNNVERQYGGPESVLQLRHCHFCIPAKHDLCAKILPARSAYDSDGILDAVCFCDGKQNCVRQQNIHKRDNSRARIPAREHPTFDD